jgi:hypothetical protein
MKGVWTMKKCDCGHPSCKQYFVSCTGTDGRVPKDVAELIVDAPALLELVKEMRAYFEITSTCESFVKRIDALKSCQS